MDINFCNYNELIRLEVEKKNQADRRWEWEVKSISPNTIKIRWGKLDYTGGTNNAFSIKSFQGHIVMCSPTGNPICKFMPETDIEAIVQGICTMEQYIKEH